MSISETLSHAPSYFGHVRNGVIVLDTQISLSEGQAVRVEPLPASHGSQIKTEHVQRVQELFDIWTREDGESAEETADRLHLAIQANRGLGFRSPDLR